jgi:predicted permease
MILDSLLPVFALLILGAFLKHRGYADAQFFQTSDRLIYYIFFPMMLFWKIGSARSGQEVVLGLNLAALSAIGFIYLLSTAAIVLFRVGAFQAGSFSQCCYRFNTYVGMAVVLNALGENAVRLFGILIGFAIPMINMVAVSTLIWFSSQDFTIRQRFKMTVRSIVTNPLILGCLAGILYSRMRWGFPLYLENCFRLAASVTLPLALLSIGAALTFATVKEYWRLCLAGAAIKLILLPAVGYTALRLFGVEGLAFKVGMLFFALPTSTAIYVLSSQLESDVRLASAAIVTSTVASFFSMSWVLTVFI